MVAVMPTMKVTVDMDRVRAGYGPIIQVTYNGFTYYADSLEVRGHVGLCLHGLPGVAEEECKCVVEVESERLSFDAYMREQHGDRS